MKSALLNRRGQFIPITGMVLFTMMVFLIAVVNIYTVTREKLKVQNLADAAALNLAAQQAQAYNLIADKNEWLNHMMEGVGSPNDPGGPSCDFFNNANATMIPGISCVENNDGTGLNLTLRRYQGNNDRANRRHIFWSRDGAINYGMVVHTVNQAQRLFIQAYNSFLRAPPSAGGVQGSNASPKNFSELLKKDIPALNDPNLRLVAWNSRNGEARAAPMLTTLDDLGSGSTLESKMDALEFETKGDIPTRFFSGNNSTNFIAGATFEQLLYGCVPNNWVNGNSSYGQCGPLNGSSEQYKVGYLKPADNAPRLSVGGQSADRIGVGVAIQKRVKLPVGSKTVIATAKAYVIESGGPFRPTYWVKLGK